MVNFVNRFTDVSIIGKNGSFTIGYLCWALGRVSSIAPFYVKYFHSLRSPFSRTLLQVRESALTPARPRPPPSPFSRLRSGHTAGPPTTDRSSSGTGEPSNTSGTGEPSNTSGTGEPSNTSGTGETSNTSGTGDHSNTSGTSDHSNPSGTGKLGTGSCQRERTRRADNSEL